MYMYKLKSWFRFEKLYFDACVIDKVVKVPLVAGAAKNNNGTEGEWLTKDWKKANNIICNNFLQSLLLNFTFEY